MSSFANVCSTSRAGMTRKTNGRKGTAAAHYIMGGPTANRHNAFTLGTATTEIYVMHGETAAAARCSLLPGRFVASQIDPVHPHRRPRSVAQFTAGVKGGRGAP